MSVQPARACWALMAEDRQRRRHSAVLRGQSSATLLRHRMVVARSIVSRPQPAWAEIKASVGIKGRDQGRTGIRTWAETKALRRISEVCSVRLTILRAEVQARTATFVCRRADPWLRAQFRVRQVLEEPLVIAE